MAAKRPEIQHAYPSTPSIVSSSVSSTSTLLPSPLGRAVRPPALNPSLSRGPPSRSPNNSALNSSPYGVTTARKAAVAPSISDKYNLSIDPSTWGPAVNREEPDDWLHNPDPRRDKRSDRGGTIFTARGMGNLGCLLVLTVGFIALFAGYPIISYFMTHDLSTFGAFNIGGTNASGQIPSMPGNWGMIDQDTPKEAHTYPSYMIDGEDLRLVFSDEFNVDGRTFYAGDDPYWQAVDLHYWGTGNLEWYDPAAITTSDGALHITLSEKNTHELKFEGGMLSSWNKFCFTGGLIQTSVRLPGPNNIHGLWPAIWTMGNLGRAGYGATLDGTWPYTYDSCDIGTVKNQSIDKLPEVTQTTGPEYANFELSYLPGQKLSRCTCPGESHPGPMHADGTFVGRAAPEIDIFEAQTDKRGFVSMSAQAAPFNARYEWYNETNRIMWVESEDDLFENDYKGGVFQQALSCVGATAQECYSPGGGCFSTYGFEYKPGFDNAYITWINNGTKAWTIMSDGLAKDTETEIGPRPISQEPMYIIMNLGISEGFGAIDYEHLTFPVTMSVDWVRVYQPADAINVGCDPKGFPTKAYIDEYLEAYTNPNLTTWVDDYKQAWPKNSLVKQC